MCVADIFQIQNNIVHYQGYAHHWKTGMIYFLIPTCTCEWVFSFRILIFAQKCITNTLYFIHHDGAKYRDETNLTLIHIGTWLLLAFPDTKVHGANMGPTWVLSAPNGPHVGPMNLAIRVVLLLYVIHAVRFWIILVFAWVFVLTQYPGSFVAR